MTDITPPPELVQRLCDKAFLIGVDGAPRGDVDVWLICESYRAGYEQRGEVNEAKLQQARDQELEACCEWLCHEYRYGVDLALKLRAARRPKPPSLKEQALELARPAGTEGAYVTFGPEELALIRRALEALPDD